jgi:hypothetical protein
MSKGPGKWQRVILERVERGEVVTIPDLLHVDFSRCRSGGEALKADYSQRVAIERAIKTLARRGRVQLGRARFEDGFQKAYKRQWVAIPLSVEYPIQHLDTKGNRCRIFPSRSDADCRRLGNGQIHRKELPTPEK